MTIEELLEKLNKRFDTLETQTNARFDTLETRTNARFDTLEQGQAQTNTRLHTLEAGQRTLQKHFRGMKMIVTRLRKDVSYMIKEFDTRITQNQRRIARIEGHIGLPQKN